MSNNLNYRAAIDNAGVMTKLSLIGTVVGAVFALLLLSLGVIKSSFANSDTFSVVVIPYAIAALFGLAATLYGMFAKGAAIENEEKVLLAKRHDNNMLAVDEDARFTQQRSFENYSHYVPYVLSVLSALLIGLMVMLFFQHWAERSAELREAVLDAPANPMYMVFTAAVIGVISLFVGAFYNGQSRLDAFRWLRPFGAWMIAGTFSSAAAVVAGLCMKSGHASYDSVIAKILLVIYLVLAVELVISFVVEFYRPRTLEETRPVFESRLLALFTEPGGVMRNFANMLDYQFGFKVSSTWMYSFVERALFPLLVVWALLLWGSTTIHEVAPNEVGLRSNLGRLTNTEEPLKPGIYFTLPWPFGTIDKYSCDQIYEVIIGHEEHDDHEEEEEVEDDGHGHAPPPKKKPSAESNRVVLWTAEHGEGNNNFIVANDASNAAGEHGDDVLGDFYFVGLSMPIQYHIRPDGVFKYVYGSVDAQAVIKSIGHMVVTEYLASAPFYYVITDGRREVEETIKQRIQAECDKRDLGVEIIAANLVGIHPPTQVGAEFQKVLGAQEERERLVLAAETYRAQVIPLALAAAERIKAEAQAYSYETSTVAKAESDRFLKQLQAYTAMPRLYMLRSYLEVLEDGSQSTRKYVLSASLRDVMFDLNLEEKERLNLFDADLGE